MLKKIGSTMAAGLFAILPLVITLAVLTYLFNMIYGWLGPESAFGRFVGRHAEKQFEAALLYLATLVVILLMIYVVGLFTRGAAGSRLEGIRSIIGRYFAGHVTGMIKKVPFINTVYNSAEQVVDLFQKKDEDAAKAMSNVVLAKYANMWILGMLASSKPVMIRDKPYYYIYFPNTPMPATGFSYIIPCEDVVDIDMTVEEMTRIYVSFGSLAPGIHEGRRMIDMDPSMKGSNFDSARRGSMDSLSTPTAGKASEDHA
ncbi:MAG: DUF502 domain-containing protein [bacterium]